MNILVTGGGGFIGAEAAVEMKKIGHNVTVLDTNPNRIRWETLRKQGIERILENVINIANLNIEVDAIIHCAAQTAATTGYELPALDFVTNALGTFEVCEFARKKDAEIIFTSSNKVYGENVNKVSMKEFGNRWDFVGRTFTVDELFPIDGTAHSPYGCSKLSGDMYVQDYRYSYGLKTNVYRMSCIYGSSQTGTEDQGWIWHIINQIITGKQVNIFGDGKQVRDILYVEDLIKLMKLTLEKNVSGVFNVGGGRDKTVSLMELLEIVNPEFKDYVFHPWRTADQKVYISNYTKAQKVFGWTPVITPEEGINHIMKVQKEKLK